MISLHSIAALITKNDKGTHSQIYPKLESSYSTETENILQYLKVLFEENSFINSFDKH